MFKFWKIEKRRRAMIMRENLGQENSHWYQPPNMDLLGQLIFMNVPVTLMMSQLSQWLLQQVMSQLLHLDVLHSQLPGLIELWMFSMHQALLGKSFRPISIPRTLVLEI